MSLKMGDHLREENTMENENVVPDFGQVGSYFRNHKNNQTMTSLENSAIDNLASQLEKNPDLIEAFYLGMTIGKYMIPDTHPMEKTVITLYIENIMKREWLNFNTNMLTLMDVSSFPRNLKETIRDYDLLLKEVDSYAPAKFYPKVHAQKDILKQIHIVNFDDVSKFNHQFKRIFNHLIDQFIKSDFFQSLSEIDTNSLIKNLESYSKKYPINTDANRIYKDQFDSKKLISIDVKQANATFIFLYTGLRMFGDKIIEKIGFDFDKIYSSKNDIISNFNWSAFVKTQLSLYPKDKQIVDDKTFEIMSKSFQHSKMAREIIIGVMAKKKSPGCAMTVNTIFQHMCKCVLYKLIDSMIPLLKKHDATIVAFSTDEIILHNLALEHLMEFLNSKPIGDESFIAEKYLRVEEFKLVQHKLPNGKKFYAKYYTHDAPPCLRQVDPNNKIEALEIVSKKMETN
ncbi:putative ORFan [Tupanvirus deep ocean]|uniref:ORFan n=2 Tax=Tupanvirus TaxID=2094720 RepID=A0AC62A7S4_9VIRU|nr:putative ORFan [Tupanvirus deep ocean]QKU33668.1 putative ORFan [Tupanvirus deep ocean]